MAELGTVVFTGKSGQKYTFTAYPISQTFMAFGAVYFITNRYLNTDNTYWFRHIYIGMTGDMSKRFDDHHKQACFTRNQANSICVYTAANEASRRAIETDLIQQYSPPCNG
jgi:predicted GIY-YIG superfamily endonuclease